MLDGVGVVVAYLEVVPTAVLVVEVVLYTGYTGAVVAGLYTS
jgi:hypothetical protein